MKKFEFNLKALWKTRQEAEIIAKKNLQVAQLLLKDSYQKLSFLYREQDEIIKTIRSIQQTPSAILDTKLTISLAYLYHYRDTIQKKILQQQQIIQQQQLVVERQRYLTIEKMQKRQIIENLRDKKYQAWVVNNEREEKRIQDELITIRYS